MPAAIVLSPARSCCVCMLPHACKWVRPAGRQLCACADVSIPPTQSPYRCVAAGLAAPHLRCSSGGPCGPACSIWVPRIAHSGWACIATGGPNCTSCLLNPCGAVTPLQTISSTQYRAVSLPHHSAHDNVGCVTTAAYCCASPPPFPPNARRKQAATWRLSRAALAGRISWDTRGLPSADPSSLCQVTNSSQMSRGRMRCVITDGVSACTSHKLLADVQGFPRCPPAGTSAVDQASGRVLYRRDAYKQVCEGVL